MTSYAGTFLNSVHALNAIDGYILATPGWSLHATVASSDKVYFSTGVSGNENIYVRITAGLESPNSNGGVLRKPPLGDGYTNNLTFRTYSNFNNTSMDGYGESGLVGPIDMFVKSNYMYFTDFQNSFKDPGNAIYTCHSFPGIAVTQADYPDEGRTGCSTYDGGHSVYNAFGEFVYRIDTNTLTATLVSTQPNNYHVQGMIYCISSSNGRPYLYAVSNVAASGHMLMSYDILASTWSFMDNPPWGAARFYGCCSAWNGRDKLYFTRGQDGGDFAVYDIPTGVWTAGPTFTINFFGNRMRYIRKTSQNGLSNDRLYATRGSGTGEFYYLNLNTNGTPSGSWIAAASTAANQSGARIWNFDNQNIFGHTNEGGAVTGLNGLAQAGRHIRKYSVSANTWSFANILASPEGIMSGDEHMGMNQYSMIPISDEGPSTPFWMIISADKISVVTKNTALNQYDHIYAGLINSYYSRNFTTTTTAVSTGVQQVVTVLNAASYSVGQKIFIADLAATPTTFTSQVGLDDSARLFAPHEQATIIAKAGNVLTLSKLNFSYPIGARVGIDLQPVGVSAFRQNTIQMNNHVNTTLSNASSGLVPQMHRISCPTKSEITNQSAEESRTGEYMLWPITVSAPWSSPTHTGSQYTHSGAEVRGQLNGVYIVDSTGTAVAEDYITFLGDNYILFSFAHTDNIYGDSRLFAFGPL